MPGRPYILAETTWSAVRETEYDVFVLPWGSTEPHNLHLPFATDVIEAERIAAESARIAWGRGTRVLVLPAVPFGSNAQHLALRHTINLHPSTQAAVLADIVDSLERQGARRLVVLNGHGGNDFRSIIRELQLDATMLLCTLDWFAAAPPAEYFDEPGDHAGEMETSVMQHLVPDLVLPLDAAGPGRAHPFRVRAFRERWAWTPRDWPLVTDDTGVGDPSRATAARGAAYLEAVCGAIAGFLEELAATDPDDLYER